MATVKLCDKCKSVISKYGDCHKIEWHPYVSPIGVSGSVGDSCDLCTNCLKELFGFKLNKEEEK